MVRFAFLALIQFSAISLVAQADVIPGKHYSPEAFSRAKGISFSSFEPLVRPVGVINCGVNMTAQVTGKNDVITMAGHNFFWPSPERKCNPATHIKGCTFRLFGSSEVYHVRMETLRASCDENHTDLDWAVAKLDRPVQEVIPLEIPSKWALFYSGAKVMTISSVHDNKIIQEIQECSVHDYGVHSYFPLKTDCRTVDGFSGAAQIILDPSGHPILGALHIGWAGAGKSSKTFNVVDDFRFSAELTGKFLEAIHEVMVRP